MSKAPVEIGHQLYRLPLLGDYLNAFAHIGEDGSVTLIDSGVRSTPRAIYQGLQSIGTNITEVQRILLTHAHIDHAKGAASVVRDSATSGIHAHRDDADYLEAGESAPFEQRWGSQFFTRISPRRFRPVPVTGHLADLQTVAGFRVYHTPGHTPGHVSLVHEQTGVLITGDAIFNMNGRMSWPIAFACTSSRLNAQSAGILADLDYVTAAFTHGPEISTGAREQVRSFIQRRS